MRRIVTFLTTIAMVLAVMAVVSSSTVGADPVPPAVVLYLPLVLSARPLPTPTATLDPIVDGRDKPELVAPGSGIQLTTLAPQLTWRSTEDHWYGIDISTDPQFSTMAVSVPPSTHCGGPEYELQLMTNLECGTLYYWRVGYDDATGLYTWSDTWWFTTPEVGGVLPFAPLPALPADGSTVASLRPCLSWQGLDGVSMYHITIGVRGSLFTFSVLSPTPSQLVPFELLPGRTYAWNVRAFNGYGWGPESISWLFRTPAN